MSKPTFEQKGLKGYRYPLSNDQFETYYVEVSQGHDNYAISRTCTHIYYIHEGCGEFEIDGELCPVSAPCAMVEVPPGVEYTFSGKMKLLLIMTPPWFAENEEITRPNPNVS